MNTNPEQMAINPAPLSLYNEILLAVDSSDHANQGVRDGNAKASKAAVTRAL